MKKALPPLLVLALLGCQSSLPLQDQSSPAYMKVLQAAQAVLGRHFAVSHVDKHYGIVEATSPVQANMYTKYRTRAVARVFRTLDRKYDVEMRVTNELEVSEPSLMGGGQPGYDWRAAGFDHVLEAKLMAEVQAELEGKTVAAAPKRSFVMFGPTPRAPLRHRDLFRPHIPDLGGPKKPGPPPSAPKAPPPKPPASPKPSSAPAAEPRRAELFTQYIALGDLHLRRRDLDKAVLEYQRASVVCPNNATGHLSLAGVWTALRRYGAGAAALREAASVANGQRLPETELSRLRGPADDISERLLLLKGWCKQNPNDADARLLLAYHYFLAGRADEARASLDETTKVNPSDPAARYLLQQMDAVRS